jgi:hypothetical protein
MDEERKHTIDWQQHLAVISLLDQAPEWQLQGLVAFATQLTEVTTGFAEWLAAYRQLDFATRLHLGYALRQRGGTGARILAEQHGGKPAFRNYLKVCVILDIQLPEGF